MKNIFRLSVIALIIALVTIPACQSVTTLVIDTTDTTTVTTTTVVTRCVPNDFYIVYETSWFGGPFRTVLDTSRNIIGKPLGVAPEQYISTDYYIPCDDLKAVHDIIIEYDIKSLSGLGDLLTEGYIIPDLTPLAPKR